MRWIWILAFLVLLVNCTDKPIDPGIDQPWLYPLAVGNVWDYERSYYVIGAETQDTVQFGHDSVEVTITHTDNQTAQVMTYVLHSRLFDEEHTHNTYDWYAHQDSGLYSYAYIAGGALIQPTPPQSTTDQPVYCKGIRFNSQREITRFFMDAPRFLHASEDSVNLEIPPVRCIPYPLVIGYEWNYRASDPFRIEKKIISKQVIVTPAGSFDCWVIEWKWDTDNDGEWESDMNGLEYISEVGLVKRWFRSEFTDDVGTRMIWDDAYVMCFMKFSHVM